MSNATQLEGELPYERTGKLIKKILINEEDSSKENKVKTYIICTVEQYITIDGHGRHSLIIDKLVTEDDALIAKWQEIAINDLVYIKTTSSPDGLRVLDVIAINDLVYKM